MESHLGQEAQFSVLSMFEEWEDKTLRNLESFDVFDFTVKNLVGNSLPAQSSSASVLWSAYICQWGKGKHQQGCANSAAPMQ